MLFLLSRTSLILSILCYSYTYLAYSSSTCTINFNEAVRLALNANPRIVGSKAKIEAAHGSFIEARGSGLPKLNLVLNASRSDNPLIVFGNKLAQGKASFADFGFAQFSGPSSINTIPTALNSPGYYNNWNTGVVLNIPLYKGGATIAKMKKAESLLRAAQHGNEQAKTQLIYDLLQAYEGVHVTNKLVKIAKNALVAARTYVNLTKSLYQQAIVVQSDVYIAESYYRSAKTTLKAAIAERNNQIDAFRILIGQPDSYLLPGKFVRLFISKTPTNELIRHAYFTNSQLSTLRENVAASRSEINLVHSHNWPQINLQLRHDWNAKTLRLAGSSNTALLEMNWELFSSGEQFGASKQAIARFTQQQAELDNSADNIRLSINQALRSIQTTKIQAKTSQRNISQYIKAIRQLKQRYGQGVITLGQLLDSQVRLDTAAAQRVMAQYNLLLAEAKLLSLTNELNTMFEDC